MSYNLDYLSNFLTIKLFTVSRGLGQDIVLEPYLYAYDPDFPDSKVIKTFVHAQISSKISSMSEIIIK